MPLDGPLTLLVLGSTALLVALSLAVVVRKARRDVAERRSRARRHAFAVALRLGAPEDLADALVLALREPQAQAELAVALDGVSDERREALRVAAAREEALGPLRRALDHRDPVRRGAAALLLGRLGDARSVALLEPLLGDRDADVRLVACAALAGLRAPEAVDGLMRAVAAGRVAPERAIERIAAPWAVEGLLRTLTLPPPGPVAVRAHVARALGLAGDPGAVRPLVALLRSGGDEERTSAARALGGLGPRVAQDASPALLRALRDDPAWPVRVQAARALGALGVGEAVPALAACLSDRAWWVRGAAAEALAHLGRAGETALRRALSSDDRFARERAAEALGTSAAVEAPAGELAA